MKISRATRILLEWLLYKTERERSLEIPVYYTKGKSLQQGYLNIPTLQEQSVKSEGRQVWPAYLNPERPIYNRRALISISFRVPSALGRDNISQWWEGNREKLYRYMALVNQAGLWFAWQECLDIILDAKVCRFLHSWIPAVNENYRTSMSFPTSYLH